MFFNTNALRALLPVGRMSVAMTQVAGLKNFPAPPVYPKIDYPERRKLKMMDRVPQYPPGMRPFKMQKRLRYMRGPEHLHNEFVHKQFGIISQGGGRLRQGHFEMIRNTLGKNIDVNRMFGIWRVDAPWQPVTKKGQGTRMGGGKGAIDHYVTPVKANRVIIEVAGECEFIEVKRWMTEIADKLPFKAIATCHEDLVESRKKATEMVRNNANPWTLKYIIQNNIGGCHKWISPNDKKWFGRYR